MTKPLSDAQIAEIRDRAAGLYESSLPENLPAEAVALAGEDVPDLLAELDRLRAEVVEHRRTVEYFDAQSKRHKAQRDEACADLAAERAKVRSVETVRCWTNEDGRRFVFAEDIAFALGYTPTATASASTEA